jgi:DNA-binding transcriptional regulator YiaG
MALEQETHSSRTTAANPGGAGLFVSPVIVLSREFPARPSSLPDAHQFVRETLGAADVEPLPHAVVTEAINEALLAAARPDVGAFTIVIRLFPQEAEIEVLSAAETVLPSARAQTSPAAESFAGWFAEVLRREGLSQEAAARQLGVSVRTVSRWVRGQTEPRLREVRRISDVFGPVPHR